jgi:hypothetical protein
MRLEPLLPQKTPWYSAFAIRYPYNHTGSLDFLAPAQRFGPRESRLRKEAARMMHRLCRVVFAIAAGLGIAVGAGTAHAQEEDEGIVFEEDKVSEPPPESDPNIEMDDPAAAEGEPGEGTPEPDLAGDLAGIDQPVEAGQQAGKLGEDRVSWQDIVVVVRKPFLKLQRVEFMPMVGVTMNDNLISHVQLGGQVSYYLTDVLAVGAEGYAYAATLREPFDEVAFQARRLPAVNQYNYSAALNFSYVPIYGKFAILDQHIIHWESYFTGGVGFTQSEVIPRDPAYQPDQVPHRDRRPARLRLHRSVRAGRSRDVHDPRGCQGKRRLGPHQSSDVPGWRELLVAHVLRVHHVPLERGDHETLSTRLARAHPPDVGAGAGPRNR